MLLPMPCACSQQIASISLSFRRNPSTRSPSRKQLDAIGKAQERALTPKRDRNERCGNPSFTSPCGGISRDGLPTCGRRWLSDHGGAKLAGGNNALALLCNTLPTGAILTVLILSVRPALRRALQSGGKPRYDAPPRANRLASRSFTSRFKLREASSAFWPRTPCSSFPFWQVSLPCGPVQDNGLPNSSPRSDC